MFVAVPREYGRDFLYALRVPANAMPSLHFSRMPDLIKAVLRTNDVIIPH